MLVAIMNSIEIDGLMKYILIIAMTSLTILNNYNKMVA